MEKRTPNRNTLLKMSPSRLAKMYRANARRLDLLLMKQRFLIGALVARGIVLEAEVSKP